MTTTVEQPIRRYKFMAVDVLKRLREAVIEDVPGYYLTAPIVRALNEAEAVLAGHRSQLDRIEEKLDRLTTPPSQP